MRLVLYLVWKRSGRKDNTIAEGLPSWPRTQKEEHWEAGDKAVRRRGGWGSAGVARYVTVFASRLNSHQKHPP